MQKIYVITSGEYSDYSIDAIFSDEKTAKKYVEVHTEHFWRPRIEEWNMDEVTIEDLARQEEDTLFCYEFTFSEDGNLIGQDRFVMEDYMQTIVEDEFWIVGKTSRISNLRIKVCDKNKTRDQCLKIAQDMRAKYLAEKEGLC